jgi:hypothetical protein
VLLIASKTSWSPNVALGRYGGGTVEKYVSWGKVKNDGKWSKESLLAGSKTWGIASKKKTYANSALSTTNARESMSDFFDHLEVFSQKHHHHAIY